MKTYNDTGIENLRFAIVKTAVDDYKKNAQNRTET